VIAAADVPEVADQYPFAFRLSLTYTLSASGLRTQAEVANEGDAPMPFGLGFHPYFRVPLVEGGRRENCRLLLWAPQVWELDQESLPTGRVLPAPGTVDARGYPTLGAAVFDTLYTRLALDDPGAGAWSGRYLDPVAGVEVILIADAAFREGVLFAPTTRRSSASSPIRATDALNLQARGIDARSARPGAWRALVRRLYDHRPRHHLCRLSRTISPQRHRGGTESHRVREKGRFSVVLCAFSVPLW
jgi:aldose 1-epimerase